jgi:hypothetical protein
LARDGKGPYSSKEENVFIIASGLVFATLGILFWLFRRQRIHHSTISRQDSEAKGDPGEHQEELDDDQAAEVVSTWNLLHPS